jgi:nucleoside-diphosphate-sugar epimerase
MNILIIGGTRNVGHFLCLRLLADGHQVTVLNRGQTADDLPASVTRLRANRSDPAQLKQALADHSFETVVDMTLYTGPDAQTSVELLADRVGHYVFISTGQVYLVRTSVGRPFKEEHYCGPLIEPPPVERENDYQNWLYGVDKRAAEDVLADAWSQRGFPYVSLRLPMVHSPRDHYGRIHGYWRRIRDGGPILLPDGSRLGIRHIYAADVVEAILRVLSPGPWTGQAYNVGQDETLSLDEFLGLLAHLAGQPLKTVTVERAALELQGLLPACSPFSGLWMSELDNQRSKTELGLTYTPMAVYVPKLVEHFQTAQQPQPLSYQGREKELALPKKVAQNPKLSLKLP